MNFKNEDLKRYIVANFGSYKLIKGNSVIQYRARRMRQYCSVVDAYNSISLLGLTTDYRYFKKAMLFLSKNK